MNKIYYLPYSQDFLAHHGIHGQKWGTRRWQNEDGSLTPEGRIHYGYGEARGSVGNSGHVMSYKDNKRLAKTLTKAINKQTRDSYAMKGADDSERYKNQREVKKRMADTIDNTDEQKAMLKAHDKLVKYDETTGMVKDKDGKWHRREWTDEEKKESEKLVADYEKAAKEALNKETEIRKAFKQELLGAKLKDLGQEDTEEGRRVLDAIIKDDGILSEWSSLKSGKEAKTALKELSNQKWQPLTSENSKASFSDSDKSSMLNNAKNNDKWDMNFLESIQNSRILYNNDTKAMLTEYQKYLDDPYDYMENGSRRLKNM